jgi:hypothetical protein
MAIVKAELTNEARKRFANMAVTGRSYLIEQFETGEGGHDPANPTLSLTPDVSLTELPQKSFGPKAIQVTDKVLTDMFTVKVTITLAETEAVGPLSNIMLIARINSSPIPNDSELNTTFPFAVANMPMQNKLAGETKEYDLIINY